MTDPQLECNRAIWLAIICSGCVALLVYVLCLVFM